jgi:hypothetical protein
MREVEASRVVAGKGQLLHEHSIPGLAAQR